jgi:hypothetical protein
MCFQVKGYHPAEGVVSLSLDASCLEEAQGMAGARGLNVISIQRDWMEIMHQRDDYQSLSALLG